MCVSVWLNVFPPKNSVSDKVGPGNFVGSRVIDFNKHDRSRFGSYFQNHEEYFPKNSMQARTLGEITLGPDSSARGGYYFMNFNTSKKITVEIGHHSL